MTAVERLAEIIRQRGRLEQDYRDRPCHTLEVEYAGQRHLFGSFHGGYVLHTNDYGTMQVWSEDALLWNRLLTEKPELVRK